MRQIDLTEYELDIKALAKDGQSATEKVKYDVRGSLIEVLFAPELQLTAREVLDRDDLARKIRDWPDNNLLLEDADYEKVKRSMETVRGMGRNEVQFIRRVLEAPKVEVQKAEVAQAQPESKAA